MNTLLTLVLTVFLFYGASATQKSKRFRQIPALNGVHRQGFFATKTYVGMSNNQRCAGQCIITDPCVFFVHNLGNKTCYFYDWPLAVNSTSNTWTENSTAFIAEEDVLSNETLYHYIREQNEAWIITLIPGLSWQLARADCMLKDGDLLPVLSYDVYERFNYLEATYGNLVSPSWVGLVLDISLLWKNLDGSNATYLILDTVTCSGGNPFMTCGTLFHTYAGFKLGGCGCYDNFFPYVCRYNQF